MAFDTATRGRLQRFVTDARRVLEEEFTQQLQNDYGLDPVSATVTPLDHLSHLTGRQYETARILRDTLSHYCAQPGTTEMSGLDRIVREQAFTILNRLAALRMAEARGLLIESVGNGYRAKGFQLYARLAGTGLGETGDTYRVYLQCVFDEFAQDLPGLFDRYSPQGRLFPREAALLQVLALINHGEIEPLWAEDETIGWIYQYFNSKEERKAMRDASQAPRNSRELAVRNQFFTPRYVVEFLVDNTLGRLWFNWTGGQTSLRDRCQYLLVKPDEQLEPAQRLRDPRTIKLLDPACGSMHFGLYAFDLFQEIYSEAWDWERVHGPEKLDRETGGKPDLKPLAEIYADQDAFLRDVPRLIVEHNIYGVDIDPRAAQIASLALWLRAQRAWHETGVKAMDRPQVGHGNVVAAVAPPAEVGLRKRFMKELDYLDAELFEQTLFMLKGLPELGILLQVEKELPALVRKVFGEHGPMFEKEDMAQWQKAEFRLRRALMDYAHAARSTYQGRLFAEDALQGLRMIDQCGEVFDVVVMNPPFGEPAEFTRPILTKNYPDTYKNIFSVFIQRALELSGGQGLVGSITSRTFMFLPDFEELRSNILKSGQRLRLCAELGDDVLDNATVRVSANVFANACTVEPAWFARLVDVPNENKPDVLREKICLEQVGKADPDVYKISSTLFAGLPKSVFSYTTPVFLLEAFSKNEPLQPTYAWVRRVPGTGDNEATLRLRTEVLDTNLAPEGNWLNYAKGGSFSPYFAECDLVIWSPDVQKLLTNQRMGGINLIAKPQSNELFGAPSLTFAYANDFGLDVRPLRAGSLFDSGGPIVFSNDYQDRWKLLGLLNSRAMRRLLFILTPERFKQVGLIQSLPIPKEIDARIVLSVKLAVSAKAQLDNFNERSSQFIAPLRLNHVGYAESVVETIVKQLDLERKYWEAVSEIENCSFEAFKFTSEQRAEIIRDVGSVPTEYSIGRFEFDIRKSDLSAGGREVGKGMLTCSYHNSGPLERICHLVKSHPDVVARDGRVSDFLSNVFAKDYADSVFSWLVGGAFGRWDLENSQVPADEYNAEAAFFVQGVSSAGTNRKAHQHAVLVTEAGNTHDLIKLVRDGIFSLWPNAAGSSEDAICRALGVDQLGDVVQGGGTFFESHLKKYSASGRRAPIYWPLSTISGSYTLWLYYPCLTNQTLYTAIIDFVEPKLNQVSRDAATLRDKGAARSRDDEKAYEALQAFELELIELRDTLLHIAPSYRPNHDDGVQITAAPLWQLFRHKPWQKILKDTWAKLEKGDYDWAHLAMAYWPDRVREKCKTDKSLAIAHDLEELYIEPESSPKKGRVAS